MNIAKQFLASIYSKYIGEKIPHYYIELENAIGNSKNLLDVGCGNSSPIMHFSKKIYSIGVDGYQPSIDKSRNLNIHNEYYLSDILKIESLFKQSSFDCVLASDVIEHLEKEDGYELIRQLELLSRDLVIIFTPNGFVPQEEHDNNPLQKHKSGWTVEEMENRGYHVVGISGWKILLSNNGLSKNLPLWLKSILIQITQFLVKNRPKHAYQILCVKSLAKLKGQI